LPRFAAEDMPRRPEERQQQTPVPPTGTAGH